MFKSFFSFLSISLLRTAILAWYIRMLKEGVKGEERKKEGRAERNREMGRTSETGREIITVRTG